MDLVTSECVFRGLLNGPTFTGHPILAATAPEARQVGGLHEGGGRGGGPDGPLPFPGGGGGGRPPGAALDADQVVLVAALAVLEERLSGDARGRSGQ